MQIFALAVILFMYGDGERQNQSIAEGVKALLVKKIDIYSSRNWGIILLFHLDNRIFPKYRHRI
ncbi:hypothetical protein DL897_08805 [Thermoflavimicrobium daqui]|uniref:Uncharacterized protein n=1 Tax=Thermoflavimicrobium daqui TaxID=2137476 RepID=A0A364K4W8_9BACL|nr:hypothetical protein DL897_08805 [Thermoflavimicrobium daqui]